MKTIDVNFFPGWTRKSLTFTIDDGNVPMDRKFLSIVKPKGILGTFNLNSNRMGDFDAAGYREFYRGYEIANHCKFHPFAIPDDNTLPFSDKPFNPETSDPAMLHPIDRPGCYQRKQPNGWRMVSDTETYRAQSPSTLAQTFFSSSTGMVCPLISDAPFYTSVIYRNPPAVPPPRQPSAWRVWQQSRCK